MVVPYGDGDIYHKYRPRRFEEVYGHKTLVNSLKNAITSENPSHVFLITGPSGTGKTTLARIAALSLNCENKESDGEPCMSCDTCGSIAQGRCIDVIEKNSAEHRGIDAIRQISMTMSLAPMHVENKVYILDEAHQMTKEAQTSLLKVLEEAPKNVYIFLCTTHPTKVLPTVRNRCQQFNLKPLKKKELSSLLNDVCSMEGIELDKEITDIICDFSEGSPRKSLVALQQTLQLDEITKNSVYNIVNISEQEPNIMKLVFSIGNKPWSVCMSNYKACINSGPSAIGMVFAGVLRNKIIKGSSISSVEKDNKKLKLFLVPFDSNKLGENQLINALWECHKLK